MTSLEPRWNGTTHSPRATEVAEVEAELERARGRLASSIRTLGDEVVRRGDWRPWVRANPVLVLSSALALGFLLGRSTTRR
jgi:hypothetical protein